MKERDYIIMTDVGSDLTVDLMAEYDIDVIGMEVLLGDETFTHYPDLRELSLEDFYKKIKSGIMPKTTQISTGKYVEFFKKYVKEKKDILYVCLSSGLSATYQSAVLARKIVLDDYPKARIEIVDSKLATTAEGFLAILASINKKKMMNLDENCEYLEMVKGNIVAEFTVDDLMYLFNGGRLPRSSALIGTALKIKPLLKLNEEGKLISFAKVRSRKQSIKRLIKIMDEKIVNFPNQTIFIVHSNCLEDANEIYEKINEKYAGLNIMITDLGPLIASHTGEGLIGLIYATNSETNNQYKTLN